MMKVVIVGGVAAGASAAARLRRLNEDAEIVILERGEYISYANCGLPYYIGGTITDKAELSLQTPESFYKRFAVEVRTLSEVVSIDRNNRCVEVKKVVTGEIYQEHYDRLVLCPGAKPLLPLVPGVDLEGVFTLRSLPDTFAIADYIEAHRPADAVVVGGGFIGVEMA